MKCRRKCDGIPIAIPMVVEPIEPNEPSPVLPTREETIAARTGTAASAVSARPNAVRLTLMFVGGAGIFAGIVFVLAFSWLRGEAPVQTAAAASPAVARRRSRYAVVVSPVRCRRGRDGARPPGQPTDRRRSHSSCRPRAMSWSGCREPGPCSSSSVCPARHGRSSSSAPRPTSRKTPSVARSACSGTRARRSSSGRRRKAARSCSHRTASPSSASSRARTGCASASHRSTRRRSRWNSPCRASTSSRGWSPAPAGGVCPSSFLTLNQPRLPLADALQHPQLSTTWVTPSVSRASAIARSCSVFDPTIPLNVTVVPRVVTLIARPSRHRRAPSWL